jgi:hypothetical protein
MQSRHEMCTTGMSDSLYSDSNGLLTSGKDIHSTQQGQMLGAQADEIYRKLRLQWCSLCGHHLADAMLLAKQSARRAGRTVPTHSSLLSNKHGEHNSAHLMTACCYDTMHIVRKTVPVIAIVHSCNVQRAEKAAI